MLFVIQFTRANGTKGSDKVEASNVSSAMDQFKECYRHADLTVNSVEPEKEELPNITIYDNGNGYALMVNGLIVKVFSCLGDAWRHIEWMYAVASQKFTVGAKEIPVTDWIDGMKKAGYLD